jgi:hypothetical protein
MPDTGSSGEVIPLHQVLFSEYESQKIEPPFPENYIAELRAQCEQRFASIADPERRAARVDSELVKEFYRWVHDRKVGRSALCFSGGGIRSATFGLGIVQGLAHHKMLGAFDFLSTVSGGGYLGSWLSAWIHRVGLDKVEEELRRRPEQPLSPEPEPVRHLRSYSRYMSPKPGLLSADTWTLVGIFLRNLLLNWLVLLPMIAAALMFPRLSTAIILEVNTLPFATQDRVSAWVLGGAVALGWLVIAYMVANRPSLTDVDPPRSRFPARFQGQGWFLVLCLLPLWILAVAVTSYWAWTPLIFTLFGQQIPTWLACVLFGAVLGLGGFLVSRICVREPSPVEGLLITATGALGGLFCWIAGSHLYFDPRDMVATETYICIGAPLLLTMFLLAATIFIGLASYFTNDADREWWARFGSWVLILIIGRSLLSALVIFGPVLLVESAPGWISSLGGISGVITLFLGRSAKTPASKKPGQTESKGSMVASTALTFAAPLFALFIIVVLSLGTSLLLRLWPSSRCLLDPAIHSSYWCVPPSIGEGVHYLLDVSYYSPSWLVLLVAVGLLTVSVVMGLFVNINRFSLHAAYRDRLIRAYLGASRPKAERRPNPFTGFDEKDNLQMRELRGNRPFHVLNLTLNLVGGQDLAWQDRKAEPFTVTPLHAGNWCLGYRDAAKYALNKALDRSITLGTAAAVSGAAASPNMGYHSSPIVTFLLALFNVRLGWWLGNPGPAGHSTFNKPGPRFAPGPLIAEAFGRTDDTSSYVYLSDGGHFENLGLYEMVLRRCRYIVVSDAGADADFSFEDLGNAIGKIRIDLGVPIRFEKILMRPRATDESFGTFPSPQLPYFAVGRIGYSCVDYLKTPGDLGPEADGLLIYIKASLNGTEAVDIFHYAKSHPTFPHESTANQLYSESQFESYRELGANAVSSLYSIKDLPPEPTLVQLFAALEMPRPF